MTYTCDEELSYFLLVAGFIEIFATTKLERMLSSGFLMIVVEQSTAQSSNTPSGCFMNGNKARSLRCAFSGQPQEMTTT